MASFKYGARQVTLWVSQRLASTTATSIGAAGYNYLPSATIYQAIDFAAEGIKAASIVCDASVASTGSTAAAGSLQLLLSQVNSAGSTVNTANVFDQSAQSYAARVPVDVSTVGTTKLNAWVLSPGDSLILQEIGNTVGVPTHPMIVLSATIDNVTAA